MPAVINRREAGSAEPSGASSGSMSRGSKTTPIAALALCCFLALTVGSSARPTGADASISTPLDDKCPQSQTTGATSLSAGLGGRQDTTAVLAYGTNPELEGDLTDAAGRGVPGAFVCIYTNVITDRDTELVGMAETNEDGHYAFPIASGPSRNLTAVYRSEEGQLTAWALVQVRAAPSLELARDTVHNKHFAYFSGRIPGPHNDHVLVVLQVHRGRGWLTIRRHSTRDGGRFAMRYHFTRTRTPTTYVIRAQVPGVSGYPFLTGNSAPTEVRVLP